jgi:hypothetical protein
LDPGQTLENNWLFAVHADPSLVFHDQVLRTASIIAVSMIAVALGGLLVSYLRGSLPGKRIWWIPLALTPVAVLFLLFPISHSVWNLLPDLRFLQFPWRWLLVLEAPMAVFVAAAVWPRPSARPWQRVAVSAAFIAACLSMTALAGWTFFQGCDEEEGVPGILNAYRSGHGFEGTGEYEPFGADNSLVATGLPDACLVSDPTTELGVLPEGADPDETNPAWSAAQGGCDATMRWQNDQPERRLIRGEVSHAGFLILRLRSYPAWRIAVNGLPIASFPRRDDGLIAVPVPHGQIDLTVDWMTTPDVVAGRWLSGLSALLLTGLGFFERKLNRPRV